LQPAIPIVFSHSESLLINQVHSPIVQLPTPDPDLCSKKKEKRSGLKKKKNIFLFMEEEEEVV
jgi:hypothetical protein